MIRSGLRSLAAVLGSLVAASILLGASQGHPSQVPEPVPRTILALYDGGMRDGSRFSRIHRLAEMPLNHLGLVVRYHDIRQPLPAIEALRGVRGVLTWFERDAIPDPREYLGWLDGVSSSGRRIVIMDRLGVTGDAPVPIVEINRVLGRLGWQMEAGWQSTTFGVRYRVRDEQLFGFERPLPATPPPYARIRATARDMRVLLEVGADGRPSTTADVAMVGPRGAWVGAGYAFFLDRSEEDDFQQWYLNPFEFFRLAFGTDDMPMLDTTTVSGRRLYYSHVDGDGWRNVSQVEPYRAQRWIAAKVLLDAVIRKFPDLPVTVAPIAGDLDRQWFGTAASVGAAREIFLEPQVEAGIHTYSHPLQWSAFDPSRVGGPQSGPSEDRARSYHVRPFSPQLEFDDAAAFVNALLPPGKRVGLVQWSGDTRPAEAFVAYTRAKGLANINGGDSRMDPDFPSVAWVAPIGTWTGQALQVYASNSNENTYTHDWTQRFFGFGFLPATVRNTGEPRRLKPFNLYYHAHSAERLASLNALLANLAWARSQSLAPIEATRFARIAEGFFSATLERVGVQAWTIRDRGALQTVRFDRAADQAVDFARSRGVIGQRHDLGRLYVALDEAEPLPLVALMRAPGSGPPAAVPYLIEARWRVFDVHREPRAVRFSAEGYGAGEFTWFWPFASRAVAHWKSSGGRSGEVSSVADGRGGLRFTLPQLTRERVEITVTAETGHAQ